MSTHQISTGTEREILQHEEVPGYKKAFHIIVTIAVIYFLHIFIYSFFKTL
ncbi:MAG: hypothetical protein V1793_23250 [Pseudomonadota bacterium]